MQFQPTRFLPLPQQIIAVTMEGNFIVMVNKHDILARIVKRRAIKREREAVRLQPLRTAMCKHPCKSLATNGFCCVLELEGDLIPFVASLIFVPLSFGAASLNHKSRVQSCDGSSDNVHKLPLSADLTNYVLLFRAVALSMVLFYQNARQKSIAN